MLLSRASRDFMSSSHCISKHLWYFSRSSSVYSILKRKPSLLKKTEYKLIYSFPSILLTTAIIRSGGTNIILSIASSPFLYTYYESLAPCLFVFGGAVIHFLMASGFSKIFQNMVGKIYVNKDGEIKDVMISHLDKYGRRIDRIHDVNELINCEYFSKLTQKLGFIHVAVENMDLHYKINIRHNKIHDVAAWENLFGRVLFPENIRKYSNKVIEIKKIS